jgi:hypothetical protein
LTNRSITSPGFSASFRKAQNIENEIVNSIVINYKSGSIYTGQLKNELRSGKGTFIWPNGDKYIGEYESNLRNGFGKLPL